MTEQVRHPPSRPVTRPRVSVAVPTYNYGRYLADCVASVLDQDGVDVDVLIVDDASTDDTPELAAALAAADDRVRVVRHERNLGHIATFNEGLFAAEGTYVVKLDADDLLPPGALARATALLEARPEVGFVSGLPAHFSGEPPRRLRARVRSWTIWGGAEWIALHCATATNTISNPEVVMRASVMRAAGGQKARVPHTSDFELWLQMAGLADVGRVNGPVQGCYRVHAQSMQRTVHAGVLTDLRGRRDAFESAFEGAAGTVDGAEELHATARRALAGQALDRACRAYERGRTGDVPVEELVAFAREVWPAAGDLPEWQALARRRRVGPRLAPVTPSFVARAALRRVGTQVDWRRWERTGQW